MLVAALAAANCTGDDPRAADARGPDSASLAAPSTSDTAADAGAPWYQRARELDLTGDSRPDSARIEADGTLPDSVRVVLTLVVHGVEKHREEWGSSYELALVDSTARALPRADPVLRARLDTVLESVSLRRIGAADMRLMAEDSAPLSRMIMPPTHGVTFSYGYETTVRLAWDARREQYVRLWSCC